MLGPILQAVWQQIGPTVQNLITAATPYLRRIPPHVYVRGAKQVSKDVANWYNSLDTQSKKKIDGAIVWVVKDLSGDIATAVTGLPIGPLVEKVLDIAREYKNSPEAKIYINDELTRQIKGKEDQLDDTPQKVPCIKCGVLILPATAKRTGGTCMPCHEGWR